MAISLSAQSFLKWFGVRIERVPSLRRVEELLTLLRPVATKFPLLRVGGDGDGGYLIPDCLGDVDGVISPGVGGSSAFERYFADSGVACLLIDGTVTEPAVNHPNFTFLQKMLKPGSDGDTEISLYEATQEFGTTPTNLLLQMDIEGGEWPILESVSPAVLKRFKILVIEFHGFHRRLQANDLMRETEAVFRLVLEGFYPVHAHVNNCCPSERIRARGLAGLWRYTDVPRVFEVTFLRKEGLPLPTKYSPVPHPLDAKNVARTPDPIVPKQWSGIE